MTLYLAIFGKLEFYDMNRKDMLYLNCDTNVY